jgi:hypothetical protein
MNFVLVIICMRMLIKSCFVSTSGNPKAHNIMLDCVATYIPLELKENTYYIIGVMN